MKRFVCAFLALFIMLGCSLPASAAATSTDVAPEVIPATETDIVPEESVGGDASEDFSPTGGEVPVALLIAPAPASAGDDWDSVVEAFFTEHNIDPDTVTLAYYNTVTGEEHYFRGSEMMTAASVKKLPLNMYYAEKLYNGEIDWDTRYGGLPYSEVQELSLRYSNNEYTDILINAIGTYPDYRRAMCPYIGVDPDEMEFGFFTVNELSSEQTMYCLKLLYEEPERYPGVIDNMLLAAPGEYFEQIVSDYEIAQKYGWYVMDGHNCINCVGIVQTEEPILLAIFTDNCRMGKNILGEYCALMCEYTENDIALRTEAQRLEQEEQERIAAEAEAARIAAEEEAKKAAEEAARQQTAEKNETKAHNSEAREEENMTNAENAIRVVACIIACAVVAIALGMASRRKASSAGEPCGNMIVRNVLSAVLGIAALAAIIITVSTCVKGLDAKPVIMDESSDPAAVAEEFVSLVLDGNASEAEALLLGSGKLGLEGSPEDALGKMLYEALQESFSYELMGSCSEDSIEASQSFTITYLDIPSLTALQQDATNARLAQYLEAADRAEEVQADDGSWLPEVAMRALEEVTAELLLNSSDHYVQSELTIRLQYSGGEWKVIPDESLFAILSGNTAY